MTEAKIPARWQALYRDLHGKTPESYLTKKLIEELGAADQERDTLRAEVERLKDEHANQLMAIAQNEALRIAQYRRDALEEAACEAEGAHVNDERSDIARIIRELADKD